MILGGGSRLFVYGLAIYIIWYVATNATFFFCCYKLFCLTWTSILCSRTFISILSYAGLFIPSSNLARVFIFKNACLHIHKVYQLTSIDALRFNTCMAVVKGDKRMQIICIKTHFFFHNFCSYIKKSSMLKFSYF